MNALVAAVALPVTAAVLAALLRLHRSGRLGGLLLATPSRERWHERPTPTFGGVGIFAGFLAGLAAAISIDAVAADAKLLGIAGGCAILFLAGLLDDALTLNPLAKLAAQFAAAGVALGAGLSVEIVGNDWLALAIGLLWLVGITNAFNLLDNMDGLAASLAAVTCAVFALDAVAGDERLVVVLALSLCLACVGFLPYNLRPRGRAAVFMGDSGSQPVGFALASVGLASSWTTAGAGLATVLLPLLVLAIPILDTTLVALRRSLEGRPVTQGGTDHSSHRLVYYGLSERQAVGALTLLAALLGATALAYTTLNNARVTTVGVLLSFVVLVQFASFLADLEERSRRAETGPPPSLLRALVSQPRRLLEVLVDFGAMCTAFLTAYLLQVEGAGSDVEKAVFLATLPVLLAVRYVAFVLFGVYRRVWRFATARDLVAVAAAVTVSVPPTVAIVARSSGLQGFPPEIFLVDAVLCTLLVAGSRLALRLLPLEGEGSAQSRRVLIVGAGRSGRSLARELTETPGRRVVGFLDDNPRVRRRRVVGVKVLGGLEETALHLGATRADEVVVTIPDADGPRLAGVIDACGRASIPCRLVRRTEVEQPPLARASTE